MHLRPIVPSVPGLMRDVVARRAPSAEERHLLHERYASSAARGPALSAFYAVKPLVPRRTQLALRRLAARRQQRVAFPAWPIESALIKLRADQLRRHLVAAGAESLPIVNLWPGRATFAFVLTHDVESRRGVESMTPLLDVERDHGMVSSWNFCTDWYPLTGEDLNVVRRAGCEIGVHGVKHDGRLFESHATLRRYIPEIRAAMEAWGAVGFRSPAMRRNAAWMHELPGLYDSSFPHTDPFQPQPGGCCSIHPFFFEDLVELPVTLDQDFVLFELLRERDISLWRRKAEWVIRNHGLVNVIVHPDYMTPERLGHYDELLASLVDVGGWHALPRDVATWWRTRETLRCVVGPDGEAHVEGPGAERAAIALARPRDDEIVYEL